MRVAVGSLNQIKIDAVTEAVAAVFGREATIEAVRAETGVAQQPWSDRQTLAGAEARARICRQRSQVDIGVGIEAGLIELADGSIESVSWIVALGQVAATQAVLRGQSRAASYLLPVELARLVRGGASLGEATRQVFTGVSPESGTVGPLTAGRFDRRGHYTAAVQLALIPFYPSNSALSFTSG